MGLPEGLGGRGLGGDVGPVAGHTHKVASTQSALSGPAGQPEEIEGVVVKAGTHVAALSGSPGDLDARIDFTKPFSNGLVSVVVFQGDVTYGGPTGNMQATHSASRTGFTVRFVSAGGAVRINWIAIGW